MHCGCIGNALEILLGCIWLGLYWRRIRNTLGMHWVCIGDGWGCIGYALGMLCGCIGDELWMQWGALWNVNALLMQWNALGMH